MENKAAFFLLAFNAFLFIGVYSDAYSQSAEPDKPILDSNFVKGADISWLPQMEASGYTFYSDNGEVQDCFQILKEHGINAVRLRVWVNPSDDKFSGHCSKEETVEMALRAKKWGMQVMIDFHYSDSWADPSKQVKPAAWTDHSFSQLLTDVYDHTFEVMTALTSAGVSPEWVQVGNEISHGMLWPDGGTRNNWIQLAQLLNQGYDAVKAVNPDSKVILHTANGNDIAESEVWFGNAQKNNVKYDIIGLSYYPFWATAKQVDGKWVNENPDYKLSIDDLGDNLIALASKYGKEVMVVETGDADDKPEETYNMLIAVQKKIHEVPDKKGLGVFYWEPEGARSWSSYPASAWGDNGRPTKAMDAFLLKN